MSSSSASTSLLVPEEYPDATVWSEFGAGYGFVPLVLPLVGLWWLLRRRATNATTVTSVANGPRS